jgi:hypothetical protein
VGFINHHNFDAGTNGFVRIRNGGTMGFVIADGVQFVYNLPTVNLWAADSQASRHGPHSGKILISRDGNTNSTLTINLQITGSATNGTDYDTVSTNVTLSLGVSLASVTLTPVNSDVPVGNKIATFSLAASPTYQLGKLTNATVFIGDLPINVWRVQYFGPNAVNLSMAGDGVSPAGDGVPNIIKYALGLDPTRPVQNPPCTFGIDTNGFFTLTYTRPDPLPPDVIYQAVTFDDLAAWCTNGFCGSAPAILLNTNGTATVTIETSFKVTARAKQFLNLRVLRN